MASEVDIRKIGERGRELFKKISEELGRDYRGKFVAIEVDLSLIHISEPTRPY